MIDVAYKRANTGLSWPFCSLTHYSKPQSDEKPYRLIQRDIHPEMAAPTMPEETGGGRNASQKGGCTTQ